MSLVRIIIFVGVPRDPNKKFKIKKFPCRQKFLSKNDKKYTGTISLNRFEKKDK